MSFSASTCLTDLGTTPLGPTLNVYSNPTAPASPGTFVTTALTADITGGNCPYTFLVPDGTTTIRLSDPVSGCYCDIPISDNNMCTTCNLNFISYQPTTIGQIVAGDISGSCDTNITDYLIYWYKSSDPTTVQFTSGKGSIFPHLYTHPLEGLTAVIATSGTYSAVLQKIKLNDIVFSKTGGTGTVLADIDCLPSISNGNPIVVDSLNCTNGGTTSDLPQYEHKFNYQAITAGVLPEPLSTTFSLTAGAKYFAWKFKGFTVPDKLKMTLISPSYADPIILEYWEVGSGIPSNPSPNIFPKSCNTTEFFGKVTCLTGLTINSGDEILIEVIPSITNPQTSWTFYCGCLDTFDCSICQTQFSAPTSASTTSYTYPIKQSTINFYSGQCESYVNFSVSADCKHADIVNTDYFKYAGGCSTFRLTENTSTNLISTDNVGLFYNRNSCQETPSYNPYSDGTSGCISLGPSVNIKYEKSVGLFKITSNSISPINTYYQSYLGAKTLISPFSGDNTNFGYYRSFTLYYMQTNSGLGCGDGVGSQELRVPQQSVVTTGQTGSDYYISFTMPTQTYGMSFTTCDSGCLSMTNNVNSYSTNPAYNFTGTSTNGLLYNNPIPYMWSYTSQTISQTGYTVYGERYLFNFQNETYPASADTLTSYVNIPAYSAITCPNINDYWYEYIPSINYVRSFYFYYDWNLITPTLNRTDFRIYAIQISREGKYNDTVKTLVYEWSGGTATYTNSNYLV